MFLFLFSLSFSLGEMKQLCQPGVNFDFIYLLLHTQFLNIFEHECISSTASAINLCIHVAKMLR